MSLDLLRECSVKIFWVQFFVVYTCICIRRIFKCNSLLNLWFFFAILTFIQLLPSLFINLFDKYLYNHLMYRLKLKVHQDNKRIQQRKEVWKTEIVRFSLILDHYRAVASILTTLNFRGFYLCLVYIFVLKNV